jgi:kinesin family protein C2/C3
VGVQMVEIYNEQVRDLLSNDIAQKRLGIWSTSQPNGLVVPDASLHPVKSTSDVLDLMEIGQANRAVGSTALNERSSRSHRLSD